MDLKIDSIRVQLNVTRYPGLSSVKIKTDCFQEEVGSKMLSGVVLWKCEKVLPVKNLDEMDLTVKLKWEVNGTFFRTRTRIVCFELMSQVDWDSVGVLQTISSSSNNCVVTVNCCPMLVCLEGYEEDGVYQMPMDPTVYRGYGEYIQSYVYQIQRVVLAKKLNQEQMIAWANHLIELYRTYPFERFNQIKTYVQNIRINEKKNEIHVYLTDFSDPALVRTSKQEKYDLEQMVRKQKLIRPMYI